MNTAPVRTDPVIKEFMCEYCNTISTLTITGDESIVCPVCGALVPPEFIKDAVAVNVAPTYYVPAQSAPARKKNPIIRKIIIAVVIYFIFMTAYRLYRLPTFMTLLKELGSSSSVSTSSDADKSTNSAGSTAANNDSVYVPALSRTVYWNDEYDCYYDEPTDCYFFWNDASEYPDWWYWYEGISSDYNSDGDYGWMEWDNDEKCWYIITGEDDWEVLPSKYDTSGLWHF